MASNTPPTAPRRNRGSVILAGTLTACLFGGVGLMAVAANLPKAAPIAAPRIAPPRAQPLALAAKPAPAAPAVAPDPGYVVKRVLEIAGPMRQGDHYWDESGAPATGPIVITVDLAAQTVSVFRAGYEIGTAVIIYGGDQTPTPLGIFPITQKDADHVSNIYDAPMPYMLRLTNDGISIHGSEVGDGYVTHGCIGVPTAFAKKVFAAVKLGDKVIVTRGEMLSAGQSIKAA
ncbi:L,D-transpeptidase family protein [Sphingomonas endolithica]|uniref:L,D-transpeptidase family protein n=1 Tax=Sphingomonas endolithica TaxID=2972485 RepID=UPI0021B08A57|nr:L,D-transpeptidase family protein [Sphingomonas sp. ZFBP2030]